MDRVSIEEHDCKCKAPLFANADGDLCCTGCDFVLRQCGDLNVDPLGITVHELDDVISRNWFVNEWLKVKYNEKIIA